MRLGILALALCAAASGADQINEIGKLRDRQDRAGLETRAAAFHAEADKTQNDANRWYLAATAYSYLAEVTYELRDKGASERAAEAGVKDAERAVALNGKEADYYRILGTL